MPDPRPLRPSPRRLQNTGFREPAGRDWGGRAWVAGFRPAAVSKISGPCRQLLPKPTKWNKTDGRTELIVVALVVNGLWLG